MDNLSLLDITRDNVDVYGLYCISNRKYPGFKKKKEWFLQEREHGLTIRLLLTDKGDKAGFIEFIQGEYAWRPVHAPDSLFIHCIMVLSKKHQKQGAASRLIQSCLEDAKAQNKGSVSVVCSDKSWMAGKEIFLKNGFSLIAQKERFDLLWYPLKNNAEEPSFLEWEKAREANSGWNLVYSFQCPLNARSLEDLPPLAEENTIDLHFTELRSAEDAQKAPSGFGTYTMLQDNKLVNDYYISKTRFGNILKKMQK